MVEYPVTPDSSSGTFALSSDKVWNVFSVVIALFLIVTGLLKVFSPTAVINTSRELFPWAGNSLHLVIGSLLPVVELGLGIMLLLQWKYKWVLAGTLILFGSFVMVSIYGQVIGVESDCGCFGGIITSSFGWSMLVRNVFLLLCSALLISYEMNGGTTDE